MKRPLAPALSIAFAGAFGWAVCTGTAQDAEVPDSERTRFLFFAILEGLWEDGADRLLIIKGGDRSHFVTKCPICTPVSHAFKVYGESSDVPIYASRGPGLPKELEDGLKSEKREERLKAIELLVKRYVDRRFDRLRMTEAQNAAMRQLLEEGRKSGMSMKAKSFGPACPSCEGAFKPAK